MGCSEMELRFLWFWVQGQGLGLGVGVGRVTGEEELRVCRVLGLGLLYFLEEWGRVWGGPIGRRRSAPAGVEGGFGRRGGGRGGKGIYFLRGF